MQRFCQQLGLKGNSILLNVIIENVRYTRDRCTECLIGLHLIEVVFGQGLQGVLSQVQFIEGGLDGRLELSEGTSGDFVGYVGKLLRQGVAAFVEWCGKIKARERYIGAVKGLYLILDC